MLQKLSFLPKVLFIFNAVKLSCFRIFVEKSSFIFNLMKKTAIFIILFCGYFASNLFAQPDSAYKQFQILPSPVPQRVSDIVFQLTYDNPSEEEKIKRIYAWITYNIAYDNEGFMTAKLSPQSTTQTILCRKGVCEHYADLFVEMCAYAGLRAKKIIGYSKGMGYEQGDKFYYSDHAWNAVFLDGKWQLLDATWGSGKKMYLNLDSLAKANTPVIVAKPKVVKPLTPKQQKLAKKREKERLKKLKRLKKKGIVPQEKKPSPTPVTPPKPNTPPPPPNMGWVKLPYTDWDWLFVNETEFVFTHAPELPMWQLLAHPVPIGVYEGTDTAIAAYLIETGEYVRSFEAADSVAEKAYLAKIESLYSYDYEGYINYFESLKGKDSLLMEAKEANRYNPQNHLVEMVNYFVYVNYLADNTYKNTCPAALRKDSMIYYFTRAQEKSVLFQKCLSQMNTDITKRLKLRNEVILKWRTNNLRAKTNPNVAFSPKTIAFLNEKKGTDGQKKNTFKYTRKPPTLKEETYPILVNCIEKLSQNWEKYDSLFATLNEQVFEYQDSIRESKLQLMHILQVYRKIVPFHEYLNAFDATALEMKEAKDTTAFFVEREREILGELKRYEKTIKQDFRQQEFRLYKMSLILNQNKKILIKLKSLTPSGDENEKWREVEVADSVLMEKIADLQQKAISYNKMHEVLNEVLEPSIQKVEAAFQSEASRQQKKFATWTSFHNAHYQSKLKAAKEVEAISKQKILLLKN
jgi:hypothetical protein